MGLFSGKKGMIFGLANKNSIAWGITQALQREGAEIGLSYAGEILKEACRTVGGEYQLRLCGRMRCNQRRCH